MEEICNKFTKDFKNGPHQKKKTLKEKREQEFTSIERTSKDHRNEKYDPCNKTVSRSADWEPPKANLVRGQQS